MILSAQAQEALAYDEVSTDVNEVLYSACMFVHLSVTQVTGQVFKPLLVKYLYPCLTELCSHKTSQLLWHFENSLLIAYSVFIQVFIMAATSI